MIKIFVSCVISLIIINCKTTEENQTSEAIEIMWAQAGSLAFPLSSNSMLQNNPAGIPLNDKDKLALRSIFGDLIDKVLIHWNSEPLNQIASDQFNIPFIGVEATAQTYGYDIYMINKENNWDTYTKLRTLIHELTHVKQFEKYKSSLSNFGYFYFKYFYEGGQNYYKNQLEIEAESTASQFIDKTYALWKTLK